MLAAKFAGLLFLFFLTGVPVGFSLGLASLVLFLMESGVNANPAILAQRFFGGVNSFPLLAVPLFMFAGNLMNTGGITRRLFRFASALVGHFTAGLAQVNVLASMIFAGMTGAAVADAAGLGPIELQAMREAGYDPGYSAAITAASSTIGPIIPPSIPLVIYGIIAEASIGRLLLGGVLPGVLIGLFLMGMNYYYGYKRGYKAGKFAGLRELGASFKGAFFPLLVPVIIVGGMLGGIFTPTEAAAVAVVYTVILSCFIYREVKPGDLLRIARASMRSTAEVLFIVASASAFAYLVISAQLPGKVLAVMAPLVHRPALILFLINIMLLILGCFVETVAGITIAVPVLMPLVRSAGIDPVHFGIVVVFNLVIGLLTPPVGLVLFVTAKVAGMQVNELLKDLLPFFIPLVAALLVITYCPWLVTWLPNLLMGRPGV
ncbi:MAG TPA: TRAP transporter large permease [Firmicutes bacterium]|nr:TRAP transporter large permease [Bacillota bacterium]